MLASDQKSPVCKIMYHENWSRSVKFCDVVAHLFDDRLSIATRQLLMPSAKLEGTGKICLVAFSWPRCVLVRRRSLSLGQLGTVYQTRLSSQSKSSKSAVSCYKHDFVLEPLGKTSTPHGYLLHSHDTLSKVHGVGYGIRSSL